MTAVGLLFRLLTIAILASLPLRVGAKPAGEHIRPDAMRIVVDGVTLPSEVTPQFVEGTLLVPLRVIGEALGAAVSWDASRRAATVRREDRVVTARLGDPVVRSQRSGVDTRSSTASVAPRLIDGRVMLPLRTIGEALGASVRWDGETRTVAIRTTDQPRAASLGPPVVKPARPGVPGAPLWMTLRSDQKEYRVGEPVRLTLEVRSPGAAPLRLQFPSSQKYDFEVRQGDALVWKWSDDRLFTQAFVDLTIPPNDRLSYEETWMQRDRQGRHIEPGEYTILGYLTSRDVQLPPARITVRILPAKN